MLRVVIVEELLLRASSISTTLLPLFPQVNLVFNHFNGLGRASATMVLLSVDGRLIYLLLIALLGHLFSKVSEKIQDMSCGGENVGLQKEEVAVKMLEPLFAITTLSQGAITG